jgi:hypothetical protein
MPEKTSLARGNVKGLKTEHLRAAIIKGEESGPATAFDMVDFIAAKRKAL